MADGVFNIARGKVGYYGDEAAGFGLAGANSRLVIVVLQVAEADGTLADHADMAAIEAGGNTEALSTNYARIELAAAGVTFSVDNGTDSAKLVIDADQTWSSVSQIASESWVKLLVCYDPDNATGTDSDIIPLTYHDFAVTPNGGDITANFDQTNGIWGSS